MSGVFEFVASRREKSGKSVARGLRREGKIPAIIYGGGQEEVCLSLDHNDVLKHLQHESVYSHMLDVVVDGVKHSAVLKAVQRHPAKPIVMHMDFMRVAGSDTIRMHVPLHFINEEVCVGAKAGGVITHNLVDIEVACPANQLPEFIEVDLAALDVGHSLHLSEISLPAGVEVLALTHGGADQAVVTILAAKKGPAEEVEQAPE
ncbi:MAG: 50S ribosomal protein L25/general stress protein Ctc [Methylococcales bacterium]|nr:50S ribosomal protein L25/general stress protein Ctc [Methylococcales bacterium]